jgi:predicted O-methyltransferase YrrM
MSSLTRFGRRQAVRLYKLSRLPRLSRRQATGLLVMVALCAGVAVASGTGHPGVAASLLAVLLAGVLTGLVLLSRRIGAASRAHRTGQRDLRVVVEQLQRRLVAAVEKERLTAGERHRELTESLARNHRLAAHGTDLLLRAQSREVEALVQLFQGFTPRAPMPSSGDYALNPTDLLELLHLIRLRKPRLVVELGSGTSSVWIGYTLEQVGGRLISLDHDLEYAQKTRAMLSAHGLTGMTEVRHAPLTPLTIDGKIYPWYDVAALADVRGVDMLLVDGPPEATGPNARFPALHVLEPKLAGTATIVFDDANRQDEQAALVRWTETYAGLSRERELLGRHAVLSYVRTGRPMAPLAS